jgi:hypothetical protein
MPGSVGHHMQAGSNWRPWSEGPKIARIGSQGEMVLVASYGSIEAMERVACSQRQLFDKEESVPHGTSAPCT